MNNNWHYTAWATLPAIVESGELRPSNEGADGELAVLWFSANPQWEPTATKMLRSPGWRLRELGFKEQAERFGCVRFGIPADDPRLLKWPVACRAAGTPREQRRALEIAGRKRRGNPAHWFGCVVSVSLRELVLHVWGDGAWHLADPAEMSAVWSRTRGP